MLSSSSYALLRIAGWTYLPDIISHKLLSLIHFISPYLLSRPAPHPNTPQYKTHYRLTFSLVILLFLLSNLFEAIRTTPPNFYQVLGVNPRVDEAGLKFAFRAFARKYHPDRPGVGSEGEEAFREVREVFEALRNPVVRFAYDRFGADVLTWTQCTTTREYLRHGLMQSSGYHIVTGAGLLFFSAIGKPSPVAFWRYLLFAALFVSELSLLLSPSPSQSTHYPSSQTTMLHPPPHHTTLLSTLFPHRVAYQHILFLHQLFMFLSIALSRVAPVLGAVFREGWGVTGGDEVMEAVGLARVMERFGALIRAADRELYFMLHTELHAVQPHPNPSHTHLKPLTHPSEKVMHTLTHEMQNMIIENKLRKEAPLRSFWEAAVSRGRGRAVTMFGGGNLKGLPAPVCAVGGEKQKEKVVSFDGVGSESPGRLPSPRPSPPPPSPGVVRRGSSYMRARSVSCTR